MKLGKGKRERKLSLTHGVPLMMRGFANEGEVWYWAWRRGGERRKVGCERMVRKGLGIII